MPAQTIRISGARQHNLKDLHVEIPREKFVVITGLSASGKSSLTFDTLYAEGARLLRDRIGNSKRSHGIHPAIRKNGRYDVQGPNRAGIAPRMARRSAASNCGPCLCALSKRLSTTRPARRAVAFWAIRRSLAFARRELPI